MKKISAIAAVCLLSSSVAHALPTTWEVLNDSMEVMGTFLLDINNQTTSSANISGDLGTYTISSRTYIDVGGNEFVGPFAVKNYVNFFSSESGNVYRQDFGGGQYNQIRLNESAIEIGPAGGMLVPGGGLYAAFINEIYNYDETNVYCAFYEELYDPDTGEYIGDGPCAFYDSENYFNVESGYWYSGFLRSVPATSDVPTPATGWLMLVGLIGFALSRKSMVSRNCCNAAA
jgi:hypothetical protein